MRPSLFSDALELRPNIASRRDMTRTNTLRVPFARTTTYQRSFLVTGCNFWNSLPFDVTSARSLEEFKMKCHSYLLELEEKSGTEHHT